LDLKGTFNKVDANMLWKSTPFSNVGNALLVTHLSDKKNLNHILSIFGRSLILIALEYLQPKLILLNAKDSTHVVDKDPSILSFLESAIKYDGIKIS